MCSREEHIRDPCSAELIHRLRYCILIGCWTGTVPFQQQQKNMRIESIGSVYASAHSFRKSNVRRWMNVVTFSLSIWQSHHTWKLLQYEIIFRCAKFYLYIHQYHLGHCARATHKLLLWLRWQNHNFELKWKWQIHKYSYSTTPPRINIAFYYNQINGIYEYSICATVHAFIVWNAPFVIDQIFLNDDARTKREIIWIGLPQTRMKIELGIGW